MGYHVAGLLSVGSTREMDVSAALGVSTLLNTLDLDSGSEWKTRYARFNEPDIAARILGMVGFTVFDDGDVDGVCWRTVEYDGNWEEYATEGVLAFLTSHGFAVFGHCRGEEGEQWGYFSPIGHGSLIYDTYETVRTARHAELEKAERNLHTLHESVLSGASDAELANAVRELLNTEHGQ